MSAQPSYEASTARVEEIIRCLDAGEASLSETLALVKEGRDLIEHCAQELDAVGGALEELRLEDLVARLESGSSTIGKPREGNLTAEDAAARDPDGGSSTGESSRGEPSG